MIVRPREMKEVIYQRDKLKLVGRCWEKPPVIAEVAGRVGWARLWDAALNFGGKAVRGLQMLSRVMSHGANLVTLLTSCANIVVNYSWSLDLTATK